MKRVLSARFLHRLISLILLGALSLVSRTSHALSFNLIDGTELAALQSSNLTLYNQVHGGFVAAGNLWSNLFTDNVTLNINVNYRNIGSATIIGQAGSATFDTSYTNYRTALLADSTTPNDVLATTNLVNGTSVPFAMNHTSNSPNGPNSATPYSVNQSNVNLNVATARALGFTFSADQTDAAISFNSTFPFDFDRGNGITPS